MPMLPKLQSSLSVALIGALIGGLLSLAGTFVAVYWQRQEMRHAAVNEFVGEYSTVKVELMYYGEMRLPVPALNSENLMTARKHAYRVEGACARLLLIAPDLKDPADKLRSVLMEWEKAIEGTEPYGNQRHDGFKNEYKVAMEGFIGAANGALALP
jgi:hypothetical protein